MSQAERKVRPWNRPCHSAEVRSSSLSNLGNPADHTEFTGALMLLARFITKLQTRTELSYSDVTALSSLPGSLRSYAPKEQIQSEDMPTRKTGFLLAGFVSCFRIVQSERTQITGFLLPGDALDIGSILTKRPNANAVANARSEVLWVASRDVRDLCAKSPSIASALWLDTLIDAGISRAWIANIGQRNATGRIVHLLLELAARYEALNGSSDSFLLPISQSSLAAALGLSLVHLNKSFKALERVGLISKRGPYIYLLDPASLREVAGFDPRYLSAGIVDDFMKPTQKNDEMLQLA